MRTRRISCRKGTAKGQSIGRHYEWPGRVGGKGRVGESHTECEVIEIEKI